jgi:hypothetical protein
MLDFKYFYLDIKMEKTCPTTKSYFLLAPSDKKAKTDAVLVVGGFLKLLNQ